MGALDRYAAIEAQLDGTDVEPAHGHQPTEVHRQVVELLDDLLRFVPAGGAGPGPMLLRTLRAAEPMLLSDLAKVPEEALVDFLHSLGDRFRSIGAPCRTSAESA